MIFLSFELVFNWDQLASWPHILPFLFLNSTQNTHFPSWQENGFGGVKQTQKIHVS